MKKSSLAFVVVAFSMAASPTFAMMMILSGNEQPALVEPVSQDSASYVSSMSVAGIPLVGSIRLVQYIMGGYGNNVVTGWFVLGQPAGQAAGLQIVNQGTGLISESWVGQMGNLNVIQTYGGPEVIQNSLVQLEAEETMLASGGTLSNAAWLVGGTVLVVAAAVAGTYAIDCMTHSECINTTIMNAGNGSFWGGVGLLVGYSPDQNAGPITTYYAVTVNCSDPTPLFEQCQNSSLSKMRTQYYEWVIGSYWTCGDMWQYDSSYSSNYNFLNWLNNCNAEANYCVMATCEVCIAQNILHPPDCGAKQFIEMSGW